MEPLPPEVYAPAFGALVAVIGVLWRRLLTVQDYCSKLTEKIVTETAVAIALNSAALNANTDALEQLAVGTKTEQINDATGGRTRRSIVRPD